MPEAHAGSMPGALEAFGRPERGDARNEMFATQPCA
jgi:hypothetical protein